MAIKKNMVNKKKKKAKKSYPKIKKKSKKIIGNKKVATKIKSKKK
jgi:hypothetical protein